MLTALAVCSDPAPNVSGAATLSQRQHGAVGDEDRHQEPERDPRQFDLVLHLAPAVGAVERAPAVGRDDRPVEGVHGACEHPDLLGDDERARKQELPNDLLGDVRGPELPVIQSSE